MIHRAILGSLERFMGALIEHYGGAFPTWLAPVQVVVIPITDRHNQYAEQIANKLKRSEIRVETNLRREKIGAKIRDAQLQKIPYMIIVGDKEEKGNLISLRHRSQGDLGQKKLNDFLYEIRKEIDKKA